MSTPLHMTVIAKEPVPGRVKTRLVPPLTHHQAAAIATACLVDTFAAVTTTVDGVGDVRAVALIDGAAGDWIPVLFDVAMQRGAGLAERLSNGFSDLGPGVIIGMDTPSAGRWLSDALAAVRAGHDVIGMTHDGGYWGIGLAAPTGTEFAGVPMSTGHTGRAQAERLAALGRTVVELPAVHDIDHHGDIARVVADLPDSELARVAAGL